MGTAEATAEPDLRALDAVSSTNSPASQQHTDHEKGRDAQSATPAQAQQHPVSSRQTAIQSNMLPQPSQYGQPVPFDMTSMGNNLPAGGHRHQYPSQYAPAGGQPYSLTTSPPMSHPLPPMHQYGGHHLGMPNPSYYVQQSQMPQYYAAAPLPPAQGQPGIHGRQNMVYYPNHIMMNQPPHPGFYYPQDNQFPGQPNPVSGPGTAMVGQYVPGLSTNADGYNARYMAGSTGKQNHGQDVTATKQGAVRGPPRKPRQSGHALWVGNLPPQADLMALVQHICKVTVGLESVFLISKSNCAFANFKDEATCSAAQQKLHDSKFQSVRLVSRLRKSTVEGAAGITAPTGPASGSGVPTSQDGGPAEDSVADNETKQTQSDEKMNTEDERRTAPMKQHQDMFFILKSLTTDDLDLSVQTGIWATQSHNEDALNKAFKNADNVYLIFSANKSGEYFGYARMVSEMNDDPAAAIQFAPKPVAADEIDLPKAIPTEAVEHIPRGRIIDDSARGTIFWEAERDDNDAISDNESETTSVKSADAGEENKIWGKPFKLEWMSTNRLPFYRTRGLRNPWNSNREVKIARDGTELEPSVGRRLIGLFNRVQSPVAMSATAGNSLNFIQGYPPMRPYG